MESQPVRTVRIFLASSAELAEHRDAFDLRVRQLNDRWVKRGLHLEPERWENFIDAMAQDRLQDEYNRTIAGCDIFVMLFRTKVGKYTAEEFDKAFGQFKATGKPLIYTYFNKVSVDIGDLDEQDFLSLKGFQKRLKSLGHFQTVYENSEGLLLHFGEQLEKLYEAGAFDCAGGGGLGLGPWLNEHAQRLVVKFRDHMAKGEAMSAAEADRRYIDILVKRPKPLPDGAPEVVPLSVLVALSGVRAVVVGEGGAGKTTMLRKLAADAARLAQTESDAPIPIYFPLNLVDSVGREFEGFLDAVGRYCNLPSERVRDLWAQETRPVTLLLDGLNEVRRELHSGCRSALEQLALHPSHRIIITSRPGAEVEELLRRIPKCEAVATMRLEENQIQEFFADESLAGLYEQMEDRLKALCANPFLLWAIAQSCSGLASDQLPSNVGQLYRRLIDDYIFAQRESSKPEEARPTQYNYELVKRPILAKLALNMCRRGVTRQSADQQTLKEIREHLQVLRAEQDGITPIEAYLLMPDRPSAKAFVDEAVRNGILRLAGDGFEFMHESVRDYFAAVELASELARRPIAEVVVGAPRLVWRHVSVGGSHADPTPTGPLAQALLMLSGLLPDSSQLVKSLEPRNPLLAAHCLAAATSCDPIVERELVNRWLALLERRMSRYPWIACHCLRVLRPKDREVALRLASLIRRDVHDQIADVAARTLGALGATDVVESLVDIALESEPEGPIKIADSWARVVSAMNCEAAVASLFDAWRAAAQPEQRRRRAEVLLASMRPSMVRRILREQAVEAEAQGVTQLLEHARSALALLGSWEGSAGLAASIIDSAQGIHRSMRDAEERARREVPLWTTEKLLSCLRDHKRKEYRRPALRSLLQRGVADSTLLLEVIARDDDGETRMLAASALASTGDVAAALERWQALLLDPQWPVLFRAPKEMAREFDTQQFRGELSEAWRAEFSKRALPMLRENPDVLRFGKQWWIDCEPIRREPWSTSYRVRDVGDVLEIEAAAWRPRLVEAAKKLGVTTIPVLTDLLSSRDPLLESPAIDALGAFGTDEAVELLSRYTHDKTTQPSFWWAVSALGRTRNPRAVEPLLLVLGRITSEIAGHKAPRDSSWGESWSYGPDEIIQTFSYQRQIEMTVSALASLDANEAVVRFCKTGLQSAIEGERWVAAMVICLWPRPDAGRPGLAHQALQDPAAEIRRCAILFLGEHKDDASRAALTRVAVEDPDPEMRKASAEALRGFDDDLAIEALLGQIQSDDATKVVYAVEALGVINDDVVVPQLLPLLEHASETVGVAAAKALNALGCDRVDELVAFLAGVLSTSGDPLKKRLAAQALSEIPGGKEVVHAPVQCALAAEDWRKVTELVGEGAPLIPNDPVLLWARGCAYLQLGNSTSALADFDSVVELVPSLAIGHQMRAAALEKLGRLADAVDASRQAIGCEPDDPTLRANLGWYAYEGKLYDESVAASREALARDPALVNAAFKLGLALLALGQVAESRQAYASAIAHLVPKGADGRNAALEDAIRDLEELARSNPDLAKEVEEITKTLRDARDEPSAQSAK